MIDQLITQSDAVREELLKKYGGVSGLFDELEKMDRKRLAAKRAQSKTKRAAAPAKKRGASAKKRRSSSKSN